MADILYPRVSGRPALSGLSNREALEQAGILSQNFWLGM
jgi:hypothetical protein